MDINTIRRIKEIVAVLNDAEKIGAFIGSDQIISSLHYDMYIFGLPHANEPNQFGY